MISTVNIVEFHDYIWILHEKCIKISTHIHSIDLVIREVDFFLLFLEIFERIILQGKTNERMLSVNKERCFLQAYLKNLKQDCSEKLRNRT